MNLNDVICAMKLMIPRLLGEDIRLALRLEPELAKIKADPTQIDQVIMNLAVNARDAMADGGELIIQTSNVLLQGSHAEVRSLRGGWYVLLTMTDTGIGMDAFTQSRIFEPFFTTKEQGRARVFRFSTVQGIVDQSAGRFLYRAS